MYTFEYLSPRLFQATSTPSALPMATWQDVSEALSSLQNRQTSLAQQLDALTTRTKASAQRTSRAPPGDPAQLACAARIAQLQRQRDELVDQASHACSQARRAKAMAGKATGVAKEMRAEAKQLRKRVEGRGRG